MEVSPKIKDPQMLRKIMMLSMNRLHLMVIMEMFQMNNNLKIMESNNYSKYNRTTMTQYLILYNPTHTNNGKRSTMNKNTLKNR